MDKVEEITVTGSRIRRKSLTTAAPVTVLSREHLARSGKMSVGAILQKLPSQGNTINVQFNNGGDGATYVNLRGIGARRTLVLVNGRRHVADGGGGSAVDLNAIPVGIVERIEILKDGASAVYGSDAIGGVVNIITRQDYEGVEIQGYIGSTGRGDGQTYDVIFTTGASSENGSFVISGGYYEQKSIFAGDRDYGAVDRLYDFDAKPGTAEEDKVSGGGSSAPPEGSLFDRSGAGGNFNWKRRGGNCSGCFLAPGGIRKFNTDASSNPALDNPYQDGDLYNYQPQNYLLTPQRRYHVWAQGSHHLNDSTKVYVEGSYLNRKSTQLLAPTPLFIISEGLTVSKDNLYNPFGRDFVDVRRRVVEAKNRRFRQDNDTFRLVTGVTGDVPEIGGLDDWTWDINLNYGRANGTFINEGRFVRSRVAKALGPASDCTGDCVQLNLFGGAGTITQEMLDYISYTGTGRGFAESRALNVGATGSVFELVEGNPVAIAVGYEFRTEKGALLPDPITASGDTTGSKTEPTKGNFSLHTVHAELVLPVLGDMPGVEGLEISAAVRGFNYSTFGSGAIYKLGAKWDVTKDVAVRATYSTGLRAPTIAELFAGNFDNFPSVTDPCALAPYNASDPLNSANRSQQVDTNCRAELVTAQVQDPSTQLRSRLGGNPDLKPETATILTAGVVLAPSLVKGLELTADFWSIDIEDSITNVGANIILASCYNAANPDERQFCDFVQRAPGTNLITNIIDTAVNTGGTKTSGLDFSLLYGKGTDFGRLTLDSSATYLLSYKEVVPSTLRPGQNYEWEAKGNYDYGVYPDWKINTTLSWELDGFEAGFIVRFISGGFEECDVSTLCNAERKADTKPEDIPVGRTVSSNTTVDFFGSYSLDVFNGKTTVSAGINNLFDQDPPIIYTGFLADSDASTYDYTGRYFYLRIGHQF